LLENVQTSLLRRHALSKLRFLLYPARLMPSDELWIRQHGGGVRWLGNES